MVEGGLSGGRGCGPALPFERDVTEGMFCWRNVVKAVVKSGLLDMSARRALGSIQSGVVVVSPGGGVPTLVVGVVR